MGKRRFRVNNTLKGRIERELNIYVKSGAIVFVKRENKNTWMVVVRDTGLYKQDRDYLYKALLTENREIK